MKSLVRARLTAPSPSMEPDRVFIDIRTCDLTLSQVMNEIAKLQSEYPDYEIFMDGDTYAIVGRRRNQR